MSTVDPAPAATPRPPAPPAHWEADVALRDGRPVRLRPINPDDSDRLAAFHRSLSNETVYFRFFAPYPELSERDLHRFTHVDHDDRVALVATVGGEIVAVARYDRIDPSDAEVAFVVRDDHQGRGLGSVMLEHLAVAARERGVKRFIAEVLPNNRRMLSTFEEAGYHPARHMDDGVVSLAFDIEPTDSSIAVRLAREHRAESISVARLVAPESVVVVGAGRDPASLGHRLLRHVLEGGFTGRVSAVNQAAAEAGQQVLGVPTYASVTEVPEAVALALVAVPAERVMDVVDDCAAAAVAGMLVVSSGYAESGPDGVARQRQLVRRARGNGMRVIGPNALGIVNTDPDVSLNASLAPRMPGRAADRLLLPERLARRHASSPEPYAEASASRRSSPPETAPTSRATTCCSSGRTTTRPTSCCSTWRAWATRASSPASRAASRAASRSWRCAPGRSTQAYPLGHTIRRTTLPPAAVDAMFAQSGVIETDTLGELFDVAGLLAFQPLPLRAQGRHRRQLRRARRARLGRVRERRPRRGGRPRHAAQRLQPARPRLRARRRPRGPRGRLGGGGARARARHRRAPVGGAWSPRPSRGAASPSWPCSWRRRTRAGSSRPTTSPTTPPSTVRCPTTAPSRTPCARSGA